MKTRVFNLILSILLGGTLTANAESKTENITVNGKCDMCKNRIETATSKLNGVESARWDKDSKKLTVTYDEKKITTEQIQTSIAMVGHDTELFSANDKRYSELPGCCSYNRDKNRKLINHGLMEIQGALNSNGNKEECVHDKGPDSGSCCEQR